MKRISRLCELYVFFPVGVRFAMLAVASLFVPFENSLYAQSALRTETIGIAQGLSSRALTSAVQDKYGFLWFGTQNGLNRYDGVTMTVFSATTGDTTSLPDNAVTHLHEDKRGRLWVATKSGLGLLNRGSGKFTTFLRGQSVVDIAEDSRGMLWLVLRSIGIKTSALCMLNPEAATLHIFDESPRGLRSAYVYDIFEDSQHRLWLGTANGLYRYDYAQTRWVAFLTDNSVPVSAIAKAPRSHVHAIGEDAGGTLWIGTDGGLGRITDFREGNVEWFSTNGGVLALHRDTEQQLWAATIQAGTVANTLNFMSVRDITSGIPAVGGSGIPVVLLDGKIQRHRMTTDAEGTLWWGMGNGVVTFSSKTATTQLRLMDAQMPTRLKAPVTAVVIDRISNIPFFARLNLGVESSALSQFASPGTALFRHIGTLHEGESSSLSTTLLSPSVSALYETQDGALWIGYRSGAGVSRYDRKSGTMRHFRQDPANPTTSLSGAGGETSISAFLQDKKGQLWVGGYGLDRWDAARERFTHFQVVPGQSIPITALMEDRSRRLWVGTKFGLSVLERTKEGDISKTERFINKPNDAKSLGNNCITALYEDDQGQIWVGHEGGLDCYNPETKQFQHVVSDARTRALLTAAVTSLHEGSAFWVGTQSGIYAVNRATKIVEAYAVASTAFGRHGAPLAILPDDHIAAMLTDRKGNLWISTPRGLSKKSDNGGRVYNFNDGLADVEFLDRAALRARDGMLFFGSASGLTAFHPDSIIPNLRPPVAVLTELYKFGAPAALEKSLAEMARGQGALESNNALYLSYDDKVVSFHYAALDFTGNAEKAHFAYKLEGFDNNWISAGTQREAKYTSLPAGTYIFCVQAANSDGVWSKQVRLNVIVSPPWWRSWWFLTLSGVIALCGLWSGYHWRVRSIRHRNQELERLVEERTHLLQEANMEVGRQLEILNEQAREIEITNTQLQETNLQLDETISALDHTVQELKGTQAQLVQSERLNAAGMLTAGVMHEINNPNASVFSALELVEQRLGGLQDYFFAMLDERDRSSQEATRFVGMISGAKEILTVALNGSERIKNIVLALQGFTKHQHEGRTKNSIAGEIHTTVTMFRYQFKDVEVEERIPPDWRIEGSWAEFNQAMLNLLVNAAQAGASKIAILADPACNGTITLRISDNGKGMSAETQAHVFEPFYTTKSSGNSGLGLSIAKKIIEQHGGTISIESQMGEGATFQLTLPTYESKHISK